MQNWNISSSDTLKPKNILTIDIPSLSTKLLKISTNGNINEIVFNKIISNLEFFNSVISFKNN